MPRFSPCHAGLLAAIVISTAVAEPASAQPCPPLTVGNPDGNYIVPGSKGAIPYAAGLSLDAYVQRGPSRRPSIVVIHGGSWSSGGRAAHVGQILELVTRAGYHWFSLDYRAAGVATSDDSLTDLRAALAFIRCRAGAFGIDPSQLVLLGEDSGAHLAARLAAERPAGVIGAILLGGFYDLAAVPSLESALRGQDAAALSPARHVTATVPTLVIHGGADTEAPVEQARRYCGAIEQAGGPCRFIEVPGASHRIENWWPSQWSYKQELTGWLSALTPKRTWRHQPRPGAVQKDIVYDRAGRLALDAFVPRRARPTPAIIIVHGGGWEAGDKVTYVTPLFEPLSRAGLAWFSIDYRLTPSFTHDQQIEDVRSAIRFVRDHHRRFNVDPTRIFLLGESASGQIATLLAAEDLPLAGVISFYGVYDLEAMVTDASPRSLLVRLFRGTVLDDAARAVLRRYSPIHRARPEMPPLLLINGTGERLWEQAQAYRRRLTALGARHDAIVLDGAPHGLENWEGRPEWSGYKARLLRWIEDVTAGKGADRPRGLLFNGQKPSNRLAGVDGVAATGDFDPNLDRCCNRDAWSDPGPLRFGDAPKRDGAVRSIPISARTSTSSRSSRCRTGAGSASSRFGNIFNRMLVGGAGQQLELVEPRAGVQPGQLAAIDPAGRALRSPGDCWQTAGVNAQRATPNLRTRGHPVFSPWELRGWQLAVTTSPSSAS